jgi:hypothetical protein
LPRSGSTPKVDKTGPRRRCRLVVIALMLIAGLAGSDARASRPCTPDESSLALSQSQGLRDPGSLHRFYLRFAHCDDGAVGEGTSEAVARLLVDHWDSVGVLDRLGLSDVGFTRFVVRHIDATADATDLRTIVQRARRDCPPADRKFCALIERAAKDAELSPARLRAEIAARGARAVVDHLWNISLERPGEGWLAVEQHVAGGSDAWLAVAQELAAGTDAGTTHGLIIALHHALAKNPQGVLHLIPLLPFAIESVCSEGNDEETPRRAARELRAALLAIDQVTALELRARRDQCRRALLEALDEVTRSVRPR